MDNMAVAAASGCGPKKYTRYDILKVAGVFAFMGVICLTLGWLGGSTLQRFIENWDHWVALIILTYIGGKMVRASFRTEACGTADMTSIKTLLALALATNIDVLAIGVSIALYEFSLLKVSLTLTVCIIAATAAGFGLGKKLGEKLGKRVEFIGGTLLIALAIKILIEGLAN